MVDSVKASEETNISHILSRSDKQQKKKRMGYANISLRGLVLLGLSCTVARSDPRTTVKSVLCNSGVYTKVDLFAISLAYIIAVLS